MLLFFRLRDVTPIETILSKQKQNKFQRFDGQRKIKQRKEQVYIRRRFRRVGFVRRGGAGIFQPSRSRASTFATIPDTLKNPFFSAPPPLSFTYSFYPAPFPEREKNNLNLFEQKPRYVFPMVPMEFQRRIHVHSIHGVVYVCAGLQGISMMTFLPVSTQRILQPACSGSSGKIKPQQKGEM